MSNSNLITYTKLAPSNHHYNGRTHAIDTITIHCYVGQVTAQQGCDAFARRTDDASCNYVVGKDGSIGLCVEEKNGSFCSSNQANDMRAITIEVASDTFDPYAITDAAMQSLIKLCADICKRNGIPKLIWSDDKNTRVNHLNGCNMTCHRDYKNKACPGNYIYEREGYIADEVNKILGQSSENIKPTPVQPTNNKPDVIYQVYANNKWYPNVINLTDYAGVENKSVQCVYANLSQGSIKYRVHVLGGGWLPWVTDRTDYAGIYGKNIDAIQFDSNYKIKYRVSTVGSTSYLPWVINTADYAGIFGKKIDKLQIVVE